MQRNLFRRIRVMIVVWAALAAAPASADWTENWSGGTTANPWVIYDEQGPMHLPDATAISLDNENLQMLGSSSDDLFVLAIVGLSDPNPQFAIPDVRVRATVSSPMTFNFMGQPSRGNNDTFVMTRVNGINGYLLALDFHSGEVDLVRVDNPTAIVELGAEGTVPNFNAAQSYVLEITAEGNNFTGRVFDGVNPVVTVTASDAVYNSGWSGVGTSINVDSSLAQASLTPVAAIFDDISATSTVQPPDFDLNNDGQINPGDVAEFVKFYGRSARLGYQGTSTATRLSAATICICCKLSWGCPASPSAVPEPSTFLVGLAGVLGLVLWRRNRGAGANPVAA